MQMRKRVLVTGCARSGTQYTWQLVNGGELRAGHERIYRSDGVVVSDWSFWDFESSWAAIFHVNNLPKDIYLIHQIRHPFFVVRSWESRITRESVFNSLCERFPRMKQFDVFRDQIAAYWIEANRFLETVADERICVEKIDGKWLYDLLKLMRGEDVASVEDCETLVKVVPRNINTNRKWISLEKAPLPTLLDFHPDLREDLSEMMKRYGYKEEIVIPGKPKVTLCIPTTGMIHEHVAEQVYGQWQYDPRFEVVIDTYTPQPIDNARNWQVKRFLERGHDWFVSIDADNPMEQGKSPLDLIEANYDVVIFPTPMWKGSTGRLRRGAVPIDWNGLVVNPFADRYVETTERNGIREVGAGGTGCFMVARRVFEHEDMKAPFKRVWRDDGTAFLGGDLNFCGRARKAGFKVWCDWTRPCHHFKTIDLTTVWQFMWQRDVAQISESMNGNLNSPEYWGEEWEKRKEQHRSYPFITQLKKLVSGKHVLDFGCGHGDVMNDLKDVVASIRGIDFSESAVAQCRERGLDAQVGSEPEGTADVVICTEVLEHLDDDQGMIEKFFNVAGTVIYTVPANQLPPRVEKEHRRVYTGKYIREMTPGHSETFNYGDYYLVIAHKENTNGICKQQDFDEASSVDLHVRSSE